MAASEEDAAEGGNVNAAAVKGTVRALADSISVVEAERASKQVREAITQQQQQLEELQRFSDENQSLSELIVELPDSVSHRIMVNSFSPLSLSCSPNMGSLSFPCFLNFC